jgi:hypothetical protein
MMVEVGVVITGIGGWCKLDSAKTNSRASSKMDFPTSERYDASA